MIKERRKGLWVNYNCNLALAGIQQDGSPIKSVLVVYLGNCIIWLVTLLHLYKRNGNKHTKLFAVNICHFITQVNVS